MMADNDDEAELAIYGTFMLGRMAILDAIEALQGIGYEAQEAERIVFEWIEGEEDDEDNDETI